MTNNKEAETDRFTIPHQRCQHCRDLVPVAWLYLTGAEELVCEACYLLSEEEREEA